MDFLLSVNAQTDSWEGHLLTTLMSPLCFVEGGDECDLTLNVANTL